MLAELVADRAVLQKPVDEASFETVTAPLFAYLDELNPLLWRGGKAYPQNYPAMKQLLADGEVDIIFAFNPAEASSAIAAGELPDTVRSFTFPGGTLANTHFVAIPYNAAAKAGALVLADFLISPEAQARKQDPKVWGDPTVLAIAKLAGRRQGALRRARPRHRHAEAGRARPGARRAASELDGAAGDGVEAALRGRELTWRTAEGGVNDAMLTRLGPPLTVLLLAGPIVAGLLGTILPAFGYLPALGGVDFSFDPFRQLFGAAGHLDVGAAQPRDRARHDRRLAGDRAGLRRRLVPARACSAAIQHLISPLLSVPHAAAAFGLAFLIAPSGMIARMLSPELTGWERPPDLLIVNDPMGLAMIAGLIVKEIPFLLLITLAALPQVDLARSRAARGLARLRPYRRLRVRRLAADLSADPARGLRGPRLLHLGRRRRGDPRPDDAAAACRAADRMDE